MSTSIDLENRDLSRVYSPGDILADRVRVYSPGHIAGAPDLVIDLWSYGFSASAGTNAPLKRLGVAALSHDEAADLVRAVIREGGISSDIERVRIAYLLLAGLGDEFAEVTDTARARLSVVLTKVAEGEF